MDTVNPRERTGGAYVDAGGVKTYYEVHGAGEPLLLLHGGLCTAETLDRQVAVLIGTYQVFVPERRGHGRTADVEGPLTYDLMARDTVNFMRTVGIASAHIVGWSDGAMVGLTVALREPAMVRRLVFMGQPVTIDGMVPETLALLRAMIPAMVPRPMVLAYERLSPDGPGHLPVVLAKMRTLWGEPTGVDLADLAALAAPTLVLVGDADFVILEHALAVYRAIPEARLGVVPGSSHTMPQDRPDLVNLIIMEFLAGPIGRTP